MTAATAKQRKQRAPQGHPNPEALRSSLDAALAIVEDACNKAVRASKNPMQVSERYTIALSALSNMAAAGVEAELANTGQIIAAGKRRVEWVNQKRAEQPKEPQS
jgi:hypothetical protein